MTQELETALADLVARMIIDVNRGYDAETLRKTVIEQMDQKFVDAYRLRMEMVG